jgi:hypothetical protein
MVYCHQLINGKKIRILDGTSKDMPNYDKLNMDSIDEEIEI